MAIIPLDGKKIGKIPPGGCRLLPDPYVLVTKREFPMQYAILCYHDENVTSAWTKEQDDAVMEKLKKVQEPLARAGKLGPVARLMPTTAATTLRKTQEPPLIIDGPFAETKEQLLGFYLIDVQNLEEALQIAQDLGKVNPGGVYEIRPVGYFNRGAFPEAVGA
ncbi:YCII-related domain protein [Variibacter gotjawalensis]|uniref:YCII-related domain protein n=2 Tax=Variibacter gotjawalensis TaxID=1333996 RepID=A0A0S3PS66_9BRAD|nr:hypothetical protein EV661_3428 [Variibacter gotjawalensis]BAT58790.1 YCII-related domain protein [Variibacter gotjawalensis]